MSNKNKSSVISVRKVLIAHIYRSTEHETPHFLSKTDWEIAGTTSIADQPQGSKDFIPDGLLTSADL